LGVRLRDEPSGVHHLTVGAGAAADGRAVGEIAGLPGDAWVSFVVRDGQLAPIAGDMRLRPGDEVLVLADPGLHEKLATAFEGRLRPRPAIRSWSAAREGAGFVGQLGPPGLVAVVYQDPFAEGSAHGAGYPGCHPHRGDGRRPGVDAGGTTGFFSTHAIATCAIETPRAPAIACTASTVPLSLSRNSAAPGWSPSPV
jgi:hypothetical protein